MIDRSYLNPNGRVAVCFFSSLWNLPPYDVMPVNRAIKAILLAHLPHVVPLDDTPKPTDPIWEWFYDSVEGAWYEYNDWPNGMTIHFEEESDAVAFQLFQL